jgi:hypothetical protein
MHPESPNSCVHLQLGQGHTNQYHVRAAMDEQQCCHWTAKPQSQLMQQRITRKVFQYVLE